ncbi:MAG TPA: NAD-dependent epimerase/dehydratase family protein [Luteimonas sp.]|nr:NAD-dependent epimerase/dehydratase family protein [Luteimonas sp.]
MRALVFGGSGQVGAALLPRLRAAGWDVLAVSRTAREDAPGLRWLQGDLTRGSDDLPAAVDAIISCGPLDRFAQWYAGTPVRAPRVVAFGSTSAVVKQDSADAGERDLAQRLAHGERGVFAAAAARGAHATVLRPTLVYGAGRDQTIARMARFASRWRVLPIPAGATGLRQPVHVDDLAAATVAVLDAAPAFGRGYDLPGGETLPFREMAARTLAALPGAPRLLELPAPLFSTLATLGRWSGRGRGVGDGAIARLRQDLVFDAGPAARDFGYAPRRFSP